MAQPLPGADYGDLQRVSEVELRRAKEDMNKGFEQNALRPGDPGYEYNKEVDFGSAVEESGWDDEESDEDYEEDYEDEF